MSLFLFWYDKHMTVMSLDHEIVCLCLCGTSSLRKKERKKHITRMKLIFLAHLQCGTFFCRTSYICILAILGLASSIVFILLTVSQVSETDWFIRSCQKLPFWRKGNRVFQVMVRPGKEKDHENRYNFDKREGVMIFEPPGSDDFPFWGLDEVAHSSLNTGAQSKSCLRLRSFQKVVVKKVFVQYI